MGYEYGSKQAAITSDRPVRMVRMLPASLTSRLRLPLIAAPMTGVSGPDLVIEACGQGVIGSFPTHNAKSAEELDQRLNTIRRSVPPGAAPIAANVIVHRSNRRLGDDIACLVRHGVEVVITSVGSPERVIEPLHAAGCLVLSDVATMRHVDCALAAGADGLVLLSCGAGGQTGWNNPFAFVRAVRERFDGPIVLAGGVSDGTALLAAQVLGADLAYMGTKFIATTESLASNAYRDALVESTIDDVVLTRLRTGLPAMFLARSPGLGPGDDGRTGFDMEAITDGPTTWAAGHTVHGVRDVVDVADLIETTRIEYELAARRIQSLVKSAIDTVPAGKEQ